MSTILYTFEVQNEKIEYADSRPVPTRNGKHGGILILSNGDTIPLSFSAKNGRVTKVFHDFEIPKEDSDSEDDIPLIKITKNKKKVVSIKKKVIHSDSDDDLPLSRLVRVSPKVVEPKKVWPKVVIPEIVSENDSMAELERKARKNAFDYDLVNDSKSDTEEKESKSDDEDEEEPDLNLPPEHAVNIPLTRGQQEFLSKISGKERAYTMESLRKEIPGFEKWLVVQMYSGFKLNGEKKIKISKKKENKIKKAGKGGKGDKDGEVTGRGAYKLCNFSLLKGDVQSGKAKAMQVMAIAYRLCGMSTIKIVRDLNTDAEQMLDGTASLVNRLFKGTDFKKIEVFSCKKTILEKDINKYKNALTNEPAIMVIMRNQSQIDKMVEIIKESGTPPFVLMIDEIDDVAYSDKEIPTEEKNIYNSLKELKKLATTTVGITATCFEVYFQEKDLKPEFSFCLPHHENYRGVNHIQTCIDTRIKRSKDPETEFIPKLIKNSEEDGISDNAKKYFSILTKLEPYKIALTGDMHPVNVLYKGSTLKKNHNQYYEWLSNNPETRDIWSAVVYNSDTKKVYCPQLKGKNPSFAELDDEKAKVGHFTCKSNVNIREIYSELRKAKATHMATFSGLLAGRAVNFTCKEYKTQITHEYLLASDSSTGVDLIQSLRLLGIHKETACLPMNLYCKEEDWKSISKTYWLQEDIYENSKYNTIDSMPTIMEESKFDADKKPKRKISKKTGNKIKIAKKGEATFGWGIKDFLERLKKRTEIPAEYRNDEEDSEEEASDSDNEDEEEFISYVIDVPNVGTTSYVQYKKVVEYLENRRREWVPLPEIRKILETDNVHLQDRSKNMGTKGLLWRQLGGSGSRIEYCLV